MNRDILCLVARMLILGVDKQKAVSNMSKTCTYWHFAVSPLLHRWRLVERVLARWLWRRRLDTNRLLRDYHPSAASRINRLWDDCSVFPLFETTEKERKALRVLSRGMRHLFPLLKVENRDSFAETLLIGALVSLDLRRLAGKVHYAMNYYLNQNTLNDMWKKLHEKHPWCVHFTPPVLGPFLPEFAGADRIFKDSSEPCDHAMWVRLSRKIAIYDDP